MFNLDFFAQVGIIDDPNLLFIIVVNGYTCSIELPNYENCIVLRRDNVGFDFGAHRASIDYLMNFYNCTTIEDIPYDYFMFMNCGVIGPFIPTYVTFNNGELEHSSTPCVAWPILFTNKLNDKVKLVGTSLVCFEYNAANGMGPRVEGFCFCLDKIGLTVTFNKKTIFMNHLNKTDAIHHGEYDLSNAIMDAGYTLDCLLYKYEGIDWSNKENWIKQNNYDHPSRTNTYDGTSIHPFEVIFHKWFWLRSLPVNFLYVIKYKKWKLTNIIKNKDFHASFGLSEYMVNVTKVIREHYFDGDKITIPENYNNNGYLKCIMRTLGNGPGNLIINVKGQIYSIDRMINQQVVIYINNIFNVSAKYGCENFKIDVTGKFINTFIKDGRILIPRNYNFNKCFDDACPGSVKYVYLTIGTVEHVICEHNYIDIEFDMELIKNKSGEI
jgi:hypothetical protein